MSSALDYADGQHRYLYEFRRICLRSFRTVHKRSTK